METGGGSGEGAEEGPPAHAVSLTVSLPMTPQEFKSNQVAGGRFPPFLYLR